MGDIHIAAGIIIKDRKLLSVRANNHETFISPGGSIEEGESPEQTLIRELKEELDIDVNASDLSFYKTIEAEAATQPGRKVIMELFSVNKWNGELTPSSEIEELFWADSFNYKSVPFGSIFGKQVIPELKEAGKID